MKMPRATDADKDRFRSLVPPAESGDEIVVKPMFGQLGMFVNGHMFAGLFGSSVGVKLEAPDADALRALGGGPFGPEERPMGGYVSLPEELSEEQSVEWVAKAAAYVATFPPKQRKG